MKDTATSIGLVARCVSLRLKHGAQLRSVAWPLCWHSLAAEELVQFSESIDELN